MLHETHGLILASEVDLPELSRVTDGVPDVVIRIAPFTAPGGARRLAAEGDRIWISIDGVARFRVAAGREILVDPAPWASPTEVRAYLLGTVLGAVLVQRGFLVLHGNAFRVGDGVAVAVGHSGAGKSTLAGELHRRGFPVFSDDVVAVDAAGCTLPGPPRLKLWRDAAERLGLDVAGRPRVRPQDEKFHFTLQRVTPARLPVIAIYVLEKDEGPDLRLSPVHGSARMPLLLEHTYRRALVTLTGRQAEHLDRCGRLARQSRMTRVVRPAASYQPQTTADAIVADLAAGKESSACSPV